MLRYLHAFFSSGLEVLKYIQLPKYIRVADVESMLYLSDYLDENFFVVKRTFEGGEGEWKPMRFSLYLQVTTDPQRSPIIYINKMVSQGVQYICLLAFRSKAIRYR